MRRGRIVLIVVGLLVALLLVNTWLVERETEPADADIGRILELPGGDVQVREDGDRRDPPLVLIHGFQASLRWWDGVTPALARENRVIRIDLLGHGGSQKPSGGYEIEQQAGLVAGALDQLGVQGAVVVGHSMGFSVAVALAERATQLVDRLVNIDEGPNEDACSLPFVAKLGYAPVIGEAMWRVTPDFAIEDGYADAFAPGFDLADGFPNPDQVVDDLGAMTFTSFEDSADEAGDYVESESLDQRLRGIPVPLLSIFGDEDQICDPRASQQAYATVQGARLAEVKGAGHSPNVERPDETAALIEEFAANAAPAPQSG
jgi:pimeloyl-ACP methyl ester carboxylesterase